MICYTDKISKNFGVWEFFRNKKEFNKALNRFTDHIKPRLTQTAAFLELIREQPIIITSGYRTKEHNTEIKGDPDSRHMTLHAVDIYSEDIIKLWSNVRLAAKKVGWFDIRTYLSHGRLTPFIHIEWNGRGIDRFDDYVSSKFYERFNR